MKKLIPIFCLCAMTSAGFAQGLINFFNNATTLVSAGFGLNDLMSGPVGSFYFALLTAPTNSSTFTFANVYGTNQAVAGRFTGGANIAVTGWAAGSTMQFEVAGWSAVLGPTFQQPWLTAHPSGGAFAVSAVGTGEAGGFNGTGTLPNLNIFGGATGIQSGFDLFGTIGPTPEPSAASLILAGVGVLWIFHRKARSGGA